MLMQVVIVMALLERGTEGRDLGSEVMELPSEVRESMGRVRALSVSGLGMQSPSRNPNSSQTWISRPEALL